MNKVSHELLKIAKELVSVDTRKLYKATLKAFVLYGTPYIELHGKIVEEWEDITDGPEEIGHAFNPYWKGKETKIRLEDTNFESLEELAKDVLYYMDEEDIEIYTDERGNATSEFLRELKPVASKVLRKGSLENDRVFFEFHNSNNDFDKYYESELKLPYVITGQILGNKIKYRAVLKFNLEKTTDKIWDDEIYKEIVSSYDRPIRYRRN
jgi:hypothetical protein